MVNFYELCAQMNYKDWGLLMEKRPIKLTQAFHFTQGETERRGDLPKVTQEVCGRAETSLEQTMLPG